MSYQQITYEERNHVAVIILNRPEAFNAFSDVMRGELREVFTSITGNNTIRAVVLTGNGKAFCGGGDVKLMVNRLEANLSFEERREIFRRDVASMVETIHALKVPLIAAINGGAYGAGVSLSLLADIRIASTAAKFGFLFGKRGLVPDWGANYFLPRIVGYAKAMELVCGCKIIDSTEALNCGLVSSLAEPDSLMDKAMELANAITANSPSAVKESKAALRISAVQSLGDALEYEAVTQSLCQLSADHREGVMSFVEKREPQF